MGNKYEFCICTGVEKVANKEVQILQDKGWKLAGQVVIICDEYGVRLLIPLKRIIKNTNNGNTVS